MAIIQFRIKRNMALWEEKVAKGGKGGGTC